jgi:hypothetical protein
MNHWIAYFAIKIPLFADLALHGPVSSFLSAVTGLPIS